MKRLYTIAFLLTTALLLSCDNEKTQNQSSSQTAASKDSAQAAVPAAPASPHNNPSVLLSDMQKSDKISPEAAKIFTAIDFHEPGELESHFYWTNGLTAYYKNGDQYEFRVYERINGGYLAILARLKDYTKLQEVKQWDYDGTKLTEITTPLPDPNPQDFQAWQDGDNSLKKGNYGFTLQEKDIMFEAFSTQYKDENEMENPALFLHYIWNGESFIHEAQRKDYLPYMVWTYYKPILEKEFGSIPTPDFSDGSFSVSQGMTTYQQRNVYYLPLTNGYHKVFVVGANRHVVDDNDEGTYTIEEYYFDGDLRKIKLQSELQEFEVSENLMAYITRDTLEIVDMKDENRRRAARFLWNGDNFVRIVAATVVDGKAPEIAKEIFRKAFPKIKEVYGQNPYSAHGSEEDECEGCGSGEELACYPLKSDGYLVAFKHDFNGPGCASEYSFWTKTYKNGKLAKTKITLPLPKLDDLLKPDSIRKYKEDIAKFREMYDKSPDRYVNYEFLPPNSLTVTLHPWDCENAYYNMDKSMLDPYRDEKLPKFIWDGEKFIKQ